MSHDPSLESSPRRALFPLRPLLFLAAIFFLNFIARIILAPLMPAIEENLSFGHGEAGSLFLLISMGYFIALVGSGFISRPLNHRRTIILSAAAVGLGLLGIASSTSLWGIRIGLFLMGLAAGIYLPSGIATLTSLTASRHWGKAIAIHEIAPNLSFVVAPLICEILLVWFSWRGVLALLGIGSLAAGAAFFRFGLGGAFPGQTPSFRAFRGLFADPSFWIMTVLFSLGIAGSLGVYTMLPLYLVAGQGMERGMANTLIALSRIPGLGMAFMAGWASDRLGVIITLAAVLFLTGLLTLLLGFLPGQWMVLAVFLQPVMAVCFFPPAFAALSSIGPPEARNVAVSLTVPAAFILGGGAVPTGIGIMGDRGFFAQGMALVGAIILLGSLLALCLKLAKRPS